jgi:hypothetical protein
MARTCGHSSSQYSILPLCSCMCVKRALELTEHELDRKTLICAYHIEDIAGNLAVGVCQSVERVVEGILFDLYCSVPACMLAM